MSPRVRLALWALAVAGCGLSPVLFRLAAPWAGAAWQCVCLGGILWLYATTPADAIKLPRWVSKAVIVGGMAAWPWLCSGRVTWALVATVLTVVVFDHVPVRFTRRETFKGGLDVSARWSWRPGVTADWISTVFLWSPALWPLSSLRASEIPEASIVWGFICLAWLFLLQFPEPAGEGPWRRLCGRVGMAVVFGVMNLVFIGTPV